MITKIIQDTKEKIDKNKQLVENLNKLGCEVYRNKLPVGDYTYLYNMRVIIDTKQNISEIAYNLYYEEEKKRFKDECVTASLMGILLIVLIEEIPPNNDLSQWKSDIYKWGDKAGKKYTRATGGWLKETMQGFTRDYGVYFKFCDKNDTAQNIITILDYYNEKFIESEIERRKNESINNK